MARLFKVSCAADAPKVRATGVRAYEAACEEEGSDPYPADDSLLVEQLQGFALLFVASGRGNHTSAAAYVSGVFTHLRLQGREVATKHRNATSHMLDGLAKEFPATVTQAAPVTGEEAAEVRKVLSPFAKRGDAYAVQALALLALMRRGKLRIGETMGLRWSAVSIAADARMVQIFLPHRKNNKRTVSAGDIHTIPFDSPSDADPLACLKAHAAACGVTIKPHGATLCPTGDTVFKPLHVNGNISRRSPSAWASSELRRLYRLACLPPPPQFTRRSSHGLGRGGATEELEAGVRRKDVMKGRWTSDSGFKPYDVRTHKLSARRGALVVAAASGTAAPGR